MKNIPTFENFVNESILNAPGQPQWNSTYMLNYDDLPAKLDLSTNSLNKLLKGIPYQHVAYPELSDDGMLLFKTQRDLDKAKRVFSIK